MAEIDRTRPTLSRRQIAGVVAGNGLEFYDFVTYSFFAAQIGRTLFPQEGGHGLLLSLATFGAGFLTRPLGGLIIGRFADTRGRKPAMLLTFMLMGIALVGLAATPSYRWIGSAAPIMAVTFRMLQGFALGGEVGRTPPSCWRLHRSSGAGCTSRSNMRRRISRCWSPAWADTIHQINTCILQDIHAAA